MHTRPWGYFEVLAHGNQYQVKRLVIKPGQSISLQRHHYRSETWKIVEGEAWVRVCRRQFDANQHSEPIRIDALQLHRVTNRGCDDLVIIEIQEGEVIAEDDTVRYEDDYGRA